MKTDNFAYVDGANLHKGLTTLGLKLNYYKFRVWLKEKYGVQKAYIFIGLVEKHKDIYSYLQEAGFILIFKETTRDYNGMIKGNCDADLVLHAVKDFYENQYDKAVIVSSDGDYAGLIKFLLNKDKLEIILSPHHKCSILIKRTNAPITYIHEIKHLFE